MSIAFFLSREGHLIHVPLNHISTVIAEPEKFGLTSDHIRSAYEKHGERIGIEGEARKKLLLKIISQGWIRIRRYPNRHWSVTANTLAPAVQELLREWAEKMLSGTDGFRESDRYMPVKVSTFEGDFYSTIGDLAAKKCSVGRFLSV